MFIKVVMINCNASFTELLPYIETPVRAGIDPNIFRPDTSARTVNVFLYSLVKLRNRGTILEISW